MAIISSPGPKSSLRELHAGFIFLSDFIFFPPKCFRLGLGTWELGRIPGTVILLWLLLAKLLANRDGKNILGAWKHVKLGFLRHRIQMLISD